jgi:hypothetical protein
MYHNCKSIIVLIITILLFSKCSKDDNSTNSSSPKDSSDPETISVSISSLPTGAGIFVNGNSSDKVTPYTFTNMSSGNYEFRIKKVDYDSTIHSYYLVEGDHKQIFDTLQLSWNGHYTGYITAYYDKYYQINHPQAIFPKTFLIPKDFNAKVTITYSTNAQSTFGVIHFGEIDHLYGYTYEGSKSPLDIGYLPPTNGSKNTLTFEIDKNKIPIGTKGKINVGVGINTDSNSNIELYIYDVLLSVN